MNEQSETPPASETRNGRLTGHALVDARSLAMGELIARRLRERPELLDTARGILSRWQRICAANVQATLAEWQTILDAGLEETISTLTGKEERHVRLRQSAPFAGEQIISRGERQALWKAFAP